LPFGEYIPLRKWLPLEKITAGTIDFSEGSPKIMKVNNINILPLICSESIFSPYYISQLDKNIDLIVNITNDGWFKDSVGAYHHYQMARTRAVELGVPLVRAANTGISAIVDSVGREIKKSNLLEDWSYVVNLPKPIKNGTYYARFLQKNYPFAVVIKLFIVISLLINYYIKRNN
jgi:apolipoprotein N-acyltransferase